MTTRQNPVKFRVGQKVRVTRDTAYHAQKGDTFTVTDIRSTSAMGHPTPDLSKYPASSIYYVDEGRHKWGVYQSDLEPVVPDEVVERQLRRKADKYKRKSAAANRRVAELEADIREYVKADNTLDRLFRKWGKEGSAR